MVKGSLPLWAAVLLVVVGCSSRPAIVPVSGLVTLDGKPLANAHVAFQSVGGSKSNAGAGSFGFTDESGRYTLQLIDGDQPGAVVGDYRVEINLKVESDDRDPRLRPPAKMLPERYNRDTELRFTVTRQGAASANFDLRSGS